MITLNNARTMSTSRPLHLEDENLSSDFSENFDFTILKILHLHQKAIKKKKKKKKKKSLFVTNIKKPIRDIRVLLINGFLILILKPVLLIL